MSKYDIAAMAELMNDIHKNLTRIEKERAEAEK